MSEYYDLILVPFNQAMITTTVSDVFKSIFNKVMSWMFEVCTGGQFFLLYVPCKRFINLHAVILSFIIVHLLTELLLSKQCCSATSCTPLCLPALWCQARAFVVLASGGQVFLFTGDCLLILQEVEWLLNALSSALRASSGAELSCAGGHDAEWSEFVWAIKAKRFRSAANNVKFSNIPQRHS